MNPSQTAEVTEVPKINPDTTANKDNLPSSRLEKARGKFSSLSSRIKNVFTDLVNKSPHVNLASEQKDMNILSKQLDNLGKSTEVALEQSEISQHRETDNGLQRTVRLIAEMKTKTESEAAKDMFPTVGMLGDGNKIEGHQIDFVDQGDKTVVYFKTTESMTEKVENEIIPSLASDVTDGKFEFKIKTNERTFNAGESWVIKIDENTTIYVAKGTKQVYNVYSSGGGLGTPRDVRVAALMGAVKIEINGIQDPKHLAKSVDKAFQKLQIPDALTPPNEESERNYKEARFRWQHKLQDEQKWREFQEKYNIEHGTELTEDLKSREVFPGYSTVIEKKASERYQRDGKILFEHTFLGEDMEENKENLVNVLKNGLLSSYERVKRGLNPWQGIGGGSGGPDSRDFDSGGADSVFLRAVPENSSAQENLKNKSLALLIKSEILDRTDWYAYKNDWGGNVDPTLFSNRPSPEKFFQSLRENKHPRNEVMVRKGISPEMIEAVLVKNEVAKKNLIKSLRQAGIKQVNGTPIDKFVRIYPFS